LLCTLLSAALIEYDGKRLPWRVGIPAFVVGVVGGCYWPSLHPVAAIASLDGWPAGLADVGAGLATGVLVGLAGWRRIGEQGQRGGAMAAALAGLCLGWQAAVALAIACLVSHFAWSALRRFFPRLIRLPLTAWWAGGTLIWILEWRWFVEFWLKWKGR